MLREIIADAGGVAAAFATWHRRAQEDPRRNQALPGLEGISSDQLILLKYANKFCRKVRPEHASWLVKHDMHALVHISGNLENSRAFKKAFSCKVKEPVCELW